MGDNLWHITSFDDLPVVLKNNQQNFVVLTIITNDTTEQIRVMLRKYIKEKSKLYPKVVFLYYKAQRNDFGNLKPLLDSDATQYPKMFHLYEREILSFCAMIDCKEKLDESFEELNGPYLNGKPFEQENESPKEELKNESKDDFPAPPLIDPEIERKKTHEKIKLLREMQHQCEIDFIEEFAKRKETEERDREDHKKRQELRKSR